MRLSFGFAILVASVSVVGVAGAQPTAARRALDNEPEVRQMRQIVDGMNETHQLPSNDPRKPRQGAMLINDTVALRQINALMDQLETRLSREVRECNFCADKQGELSELLRQRVAAVDSGTSILGPDRAPLLLKLFGARPNESRWTNIQLALQEAQNALRAHCARFQGEDYCQADGARRLAGEHENAWASCFTQNDWVQDSTRRTAYEACMSGADPFTKLCDRDRKASLSSCPNFTVSSTDVNQLRSYRDRWVSDPNRLPANAVIVPGQPMHVTLLEPVVTPVMPNDGRTGFKLTVRGRLDNALDGQYDASLNSSTSTASAIDSAVLQGLNGRVEVLPAGTEVPVTVRLISLAGASANGGALDLQVVTRELGPRKSNQLISQSINRRIPWPTPGTVLLPADSSLSFATQCGCPYEMSIAEFRQRAAARAAAPTPAAPSVTRVVLVGSRVQTILVEPVTVTGIQAGKQFHARLNVDMQLPRNATNRPDALELKRNTDVYLKVTDPGGGQYGSRMARLEIDHAVVDGQQIPLKTAAWPLQYGVPPPNPRRQLPVVDVIMPVGRTTWWDIIEQAEVSAAGLSAEQTKRLVPPPDPTDRAQNRDIADYNSSWMSHSLFARGTVSRVEEKGEWEILHFQESADDSFIVCFPASGGLSFRGSGNQIGRVGGDDFSGLVGKAIEIRGRVSQVRCAPGATGMEAILPAQIKLLDASGPAAAGSAGTAAPAGIGKRAPGAR